MTDMPRPASWHAILDAAELEFLERGYAGVRMEHVAARADYNKSLVYRHFGGREGLWEAVLERVAARRDAPQHPLPATVAQLLAVLSRRLEADRAGTRLLLGYGQGESEAGVGPDRAAYHDEMVGLVRVLQASGELEPEFDSGLFYLAILGIASVPVMMPHVAKAVSGLDPEDEAFRDRWEDTLVWLADTLAG